MFLGYKNKDAIFTEIISLYFKSESIISFKIILTKNVFLNVISKVKGNIGGSRNLVQSYYDNSIGIIQIKKRKNLKKMKNI